jgi:hypothetical protein
VTAVGCGARCGLLRRGIWGRSLVASVVDAEADELPFPDCWLAAIMRGGPVAGDLLIDSQPRSPNRLSSSADISWASSADAAPPACLARRCCYRPSDPTFVNVAALVSGGSSRPGEPRFHVVGISKRLETLRPVETQDQDVPPAGPVQRGNAPPPARTACLWW